MRTIFLSFAFACFLVACDSKSGSTDSDRNDNSATTNSDRRDGDEGATSSNKKDDGLFGDQRDTRPDNDNDRDRNILSSDREAGEDRVDESLARSGRTIFASQCMSCHKISDDEKKADQSERKREIDAPDLSDVTDKRSDRFLVRFMTNSDGEGNDPKRNDDESDVCRVQMPGKQLSRDHALKVLEYMHLQARKD